MGIATFWLSVPAGPSYFALVSHDPYCCLWHGRGLYLVQLSMRMPLVLVSLVLGIDAFACMWNGHEIRHGTQFDDVLFAIHSPQGCHGRLCTNIVWSKVDDPAAPSCWEPGARGYLVKLSTGRGNT